MEKYKGKTLWEEVCKTPPSQTKEVSLGGRKFNTIDAYRRIEKGTELWGPMGTDWGVKNEDYTKITEKTALYTAILFYPGGELPIMSDIELVYSSGKREGKFNEDWSKKISTDALTKGLSKLGFNADIFLGKFEDNKYVAAAQAYEADPEGFVRAQLEKAAQAYIQNAQDYNRFTADSPPIHDDKILGNMYRELIKQHKSGKIDIDSILGIAL